MLRTSARLNGALVRVMWSSAQRIGIWVIAAVIAALGVTWLYTFSLTDYRAHLRPIMLPFALLTIAYSFWVASLSVWAITLLAVAALSVATGAMVLQIAAGEFQAALALGLVLALLALCLVCPGLWRHFSHGRSTSEHST